MNQIYIKNHFLINPSWEALFISSFPNWEPENWQENAWSIFERNGFITTLKRYSKNPKSKLYTAIKYIDLFDTTLVHSECEDGFIIGRMNVTEKSALSQLMIIVICDFHVDFRKFK
jgi:hypothetical protein